MQTIVLHGNDTTKSYERLTKFISVAKRRGWDIVNDKVEDTPSLFGTEKLIIIRDYKTIGKKELALITKIPGTLVIYNTSKIPAPTLKTLKADTVELFELPELLWKFLDNMTVSGFHELLKTQAPEYLMAMISWKLKQKYLKNPSEKTGKAILELADIDIKSKKGKADLILSIDLLLTKSLK